MGTLAIAGILLALFLALLAGGLWIAMAMTAVAWAGLQFFTASPPAINLFQAYWGSSASWTLAALPMFVWMGEILFRTRLSEEMFKGLSPWLGWLPGRLMHVNIFGCAIFAAVCGSSAATCATIGKVALPELAKRGYDERMSLGSLCGAGTLGLLIPPSIIMIVYAVAAEVSILKMFLAGVLPGILLVTLFSGCIVVALIVCWLLGKVTEHPFNDVFVALALHGRHFPPFQAGSIHLRDVVYYLMVTYIALFGAIRVMEARRWR